MTSAAAGVVLAGGRSSRMGSPKASLPWHGSTLLRRVVGLVARVVDGPVVVVGAPGQDLPPLPERVEVVEDPVEGRGPLQGIAVGLAAVGGRAEAAFVCSTDLPLLHPAFVRRVLDGRAAAVADVALPVVHGHRQPLAAAYRPALAGRAAELIAAGRGKPAFLFDDAAVAVLDEAALLADPVLRAADPLLRSVRNVNTPEDHAEVLALPLPAVAVERFGTLAAKAGGRGPFDVRAATLVQAAVAVGVVLDRHVVAALDGDQLSRDPQLPLVDGDRVSFLSADAGG